MENEYPFTLGLTADGVYLIKSCIDHCLERWPGGDPQEQEHLKLLQTILNAMMLESMLNLDTKN